MKLVTLKHDQIDIKSFFANANFQLFAHFYIAQFREIWKSIGDNLDASLSTKLVFQLAVGRGQCLTSAKSLSPIDIRMY